MASTMEQLVVSYLHNPNRLSTTVLPQFEHRLNLARAWAPQSGAKLLDVGCGQGESSLVLATVLGPLGSVVGIDTASPDYGGPYTVAQAQKYISGSKLGKQITFCRADAASLLTDHSTQFSFDGAVLCHSLWYFNDADRIRSLFHTLANAKITRVYLAEYALEASLPEQVPHVLASRVQARLAALQAPREFNKNRERNVRTAMMPRDVVELAQELGWTIEREGVITPAADLMDGHWESLYVLSDHFRDDVANEGLSDAAQKEILQYIPEIKRSVEELRSNGIGTVRTMDVWWAVLNTSPEGSTKL